MRIVDQMKGKSDAWFKEQIVDADMDDYDENIIAAPGEAIAEGVPAIQNGSYDMLPLPVPPNVTEVGMAR